MKELRGRTAVVLGAGDELGRRLSAAFAAEGMKLVLADDDPSVLAAAVHEITESGGEALGVPTDVARLEQVEALADRALKTFGAVHLVCNNASASHAGPFTGLSLEQLHRIWDVNFNGALFTARTFLPILRRQGEGHIVNTSSSAAFNELLPNEVLYAAAKHAVLGLTENLHFELRMANEPIGVSLLRPSRSGKSSDLQFLAKAVVDAVRTERFYVSAMSSDAAAEAAETLLRWFRDDVTPGAPLSKSRPALGSKDLSGRVAVVTGAASGVGLALAERCASDGMSVVLADVEEAALAEALASLRASGANAIAVRTDVSRPEDVRELAERTLQAFGAVHLVCNNAGVQSGALFSDIPLPLWNWLNGVNFWGVAYGCHTFLPLLAQQEIGHIVSTGSLSSFDSALPTFGAYIASKFGMLALSENLHAELALAGSTVRVVALSPGLTASRFAWAERNRPAEIEADDSHPIRRAVIDDARAVMAAGGGMPARDVADVAFRAVRQDRFHALTHPVETEALLRSRLKWMATDEPPQLPSFEPLPASE